MSDSDEPIKILIPSLLPQLSGATENRNGVPLKNFFSRKREFFGGVTGEGFGRALPGGSALSAQNLFFIGGAWFRLAGMH